MGIHDIPPGGPWAEERLTRRKYPRSQFRGLWKKVLALWSRAGAVSLLDMQAEGLEGWLHTLELGPVLLTTVDLGAGRIALRFSGAPDSDALFLIRPIWEARITHPGLPAMTVAPGEIVLMQATTTATLELSRGGRLDVGIVTPAPADAPPLLTIGARVSAAHYLAYVAGYLLRVAPHSDGTAPLLRRHFTEALTMTIAGLATNSHAQPPLTAFERFKFLVAANLARADLRADHIAQAMGLSIRGLQRILHAEGVQFRTYLLNRRMEHGRDLLADTSRQLRVSEVAYECGFSDPNYFSRAYRRHWKAAPTEARDADQETQRRPARPASPAASRDR